MSRSIITFSHGHHKPRHDKRSSLAMPMIIKPFEAYTSVVTGKAVSDRGSYREETREAEDKGLIPYESVTKRPKGLTNKKFAASIGRKTSEAAIEWADNKKKSQAVKTDNHGNIVV